MEKLQQEHHPEYPYLYSLQGFQYCDLLLADGKTKEIIIRAEYALTIAKRDGWLLGTALDQLTLGGVHCQQGGAIDWLGQTVDGLCEAGDQDMLPYGLLARATLHRDTRIPITISPVPTRIYKR